MLVLACRNDIRQYEYLKKNDDFRNSISKGNFIELYNGFTYYEYENLNNENLIVFIHGFSVPSYIWDNTYYEAINRGYAVLRLDLFGRGYSDNPNVHYNDELFSNQVLELLDKIKIHQKINLIGLSMGGRVISIVAEKAPNIINRLIFVSGAGLHDLGLTPDTSIITNKEISNFIKKNYKTIAKGQLEDFKYPERFFGWDEKYQQLLKYKGFARSLISTRKNFYSIDLVHQKIAQMSFPQYAIWGEDDKVLPLDMITIKIDTLLPSLKLHVIEDSGHLPHMEQVEKFNDILFNKILN